MWIARNWILWSRLLGNNRKCSYQLFTLLYSFSTFSIASSDYIAPFFAQLLNCSRYWFRFEKYCLTAPRVQNRPSRVRSSLKKCYRFVPFLRELMNLCEIGSFCDTYKNIQYILVLVPTSSLVPVAKGERKMKNDPAFQVDHVRIFISMY